MVVAIYETRGAVEVRRKGWSYGQDSLPTVFHEILIIYIDIFAGIWHNEKEDAAHHPKVIRF